MSSQPQSVDALQSVLESLTGHYEHLLAALDAERDALRVRDATALQLATENKRQLCVDIEALHGQFDTPLRDRIEAQPQPGREKLELLHTHLCTLAREAQDLNAVNGKIIGRSQQSVRELIGMLHGRDSHALYGAHGVAAAAQPAAAGPSIAQA